MGLPVAKRTVRGAAGGSPASAEASPAAAQELPKRNNLGSLDDAEAASAPPSPSGADTNPSKSVPIGESSISASTRARISTAGSLSTQDSSLRERLDSGAGTPVLDQTTSQRSSGRSEGQVAIRVVARIRPKLPREAATPDGVECLSDGATITLTDGSEKRHFALDEVIDSRDPTDPHGTQAATFDRVGRDLVNASTKEHVVRDRPSATVLISP